MTTVAKNIKSFRLEAGVSQETLAEQLHVTRQTISSWETGKNRPDVDTLENISSALGVDLIELIYGRQPEEIGPFVKYQKKYIVWTAVLGALTVVLMIASSIWLGRLIDKLVDHSMAFANFQYWWSMAIPYLFRPLIYGALGMFVPAVISLWKDIRIKDRATKLALVIAPIAFVFVFFIDVGMEMLPWVFKIGAMTGLPIIFFFMGFAEFMGLNK